MANVFIEESTLTAIGDAIRAKTGATDKIFPADMATAIEGITGGGEGVPEGYVTVTFHYADQEGQKEFSRLVMVGDNCPDPWVQERIELPTKESTVQYDYTFNGWATVDGGTADNAALQTITEDKVLYAAFAESVRVYTINFYDGETLLHTEQVAYGDTPAYETTKDGYSFEAWEPAIAPVTGGASYYATWSELLKFSGASWNDISAVCEAGEASKHFAVGDTRTITAGDYTYVLRVIALDTDNKADGSGKAGLTVMVDSPATDAMAMASDCEAWGWDTYESCFRTWLSTTFITRLSADLQAVIKPVKKHTAHRNTSAKLMIYETTDTLFLPSLSEMCDPSFDVIDGDDIKYPYLYVSNVEIGSTDRVFKNGSDTSVAWWLRTAMLNMNTCYYVSTSGKCSSDYDGYTEEHYIRPCFCI